jgi:hypothetical protein
MGIEFDPDKSERNRRQRGFGFELAEQFEPVFIEKTGVRTMESRVSEPLVLSATILTPWLSRRVVKM